MEASQSRCFFSIRLVSTFLVFICSSRSRSSQTAPIKRRLLPTGAAYQAHVRRTAHKRTFDEDDIAQAEEARRRAENSLNGDDKNGADDLGVGDEEETVDLLLLDPKEWKVSSRFFSRAAMTY
jgi:DnaJ homolog subfamily C member 2